MVKVSVIAFILFFNTIIQSAVFPFIDIYGVKPDTLLVLVVSVALLAGNPMALTVGMFGGITQDLLYGDVLGLYAILYMLIGYLAGLLYKKLPHGVIVLSVIVTIFSLVFRNAIIWGYLYFTDTTVHVLDFVFHVLLPEIAYTAIIAPLIFLGMARLYKCKFMFKRWLFRQ